MWKAIIGKSSERSEASTSQTSRRKDEVDKSTSRHRSSESIVSSNSARKPARGEDRDRGFNPSSTSYSSTSRTAYPGTAPASVASSYATASSNQADQTFAPPGLVRNASLADKMPKPRDSRGERRRDSDRGQRGERRERSTSRERRSNHRARSRSRDREEKRRSTRRAYDEQQSDHDLARGLSRSGDGYVDDQSTARAGEHSAQASGNFGAQVGSSGFTQFPGQYDGGLPGSVPEPSPAPVNMSSHVPDQFPGQFPLQAAAPYRPPLAATEGGLGLAAEYYGDSGESVAHQPGVRPQAPTLIVGAEPHLQAASAIAAPPPEPSATGSVGAAASFFSGADDYQPLPSSKPPKPGKQSKPDNTSKPNRPSGAAAITGSAAMGFAAASSSMSTTHADAGGTPSMSFVQQSSHDYAPPSVGYSPSTTGLGTSHHSSSAPAVPTLGAVAAGAAAGYMVGHHSSSQQSRPSGTSSSGNAGIHVTAPLQRPESQRPHSQAHPAYAPKVSNGRPDRPGKHSSQSNVPLYAAGLAGTAGVAAAAYQAHYSPPHDSFNQPYASGSMAQRHRHRGPLSKLIDFLRDSDGVAEFEEYTEYIGVCKHCFPPGSSPRDAPRKHHYRRRGSNERYGSSTRIDKESRYWSSDGDSRRTKDRSWLATGIAAYGLGKIGKSISRARENDFGGYSPRSGRGNQSSWSLASRTSDSDRRGHTSHGVTHRSPHTESRYRNRSGERVETGITAEGNLYKKDRHGSHFGGPTMTTYEARRRRSRSRSSSRDRRNRVTGAAIGAVIGSSVATSTVRHRSGSPGKRFAHTKRRSREQSPSSGSKYGKGASYNSHGGPFAPSSPYLDSSRPHIKPSNFASGGFFSSRPEKSPRRKKKSKGFFSFSNSSSSSDASLAYGYAFEKQMRSKQSTAKWNNSRNTNAAILGLGAAAAALAATDQSNARQRRRRRDLVAVKESRNDHGKPPDRNRKSRRSSMTSASDDGVWEDASEDDDFSSVSSGLAYGGAARRSQESLLSEASGTSKWGWRWGSSKKKTDPEYPVSVVGQTMTLASSGLGALGARLTGEAPTFDNRDGVMSSASSLPSLQHVHPIPTSDPSRFDFGMQNSTTSYSIPILTSRPAAIPLQQPQPMVPVSSAVYTTQAPYSHSYSAPTGPRVFSGVAQVRPTNTDIQRTRMTSSPEMAMPGTFPFQQSELEELSKEASIGRPHRRRDSSPAARAEIVGPTSSSRRKRASTQGQGSSVRSDVVKEQADKERRDRRRQEEEEEANRQAVRLREGIDRELGEKRRRRRLKDEEDAEEERFRLDASKKQSERHNRDKLHTPEKEDSTQIHSSPYRSEEPAAFRGEAQRRALASTTKSIAGTKRDGILRSETQSPGDQERASEESNNLASWSTPGVIGAAGAVIVAAAAEKKAVSVEDYQTKRRSEQPRSRDSVQNGSGKLSSSMRQSPTQASDDVRDQEVQVTRKVGSKAAPSPRHEDYATYFAPPELLARSGKQQQDYSPNTDDEGAVFQIPHYITIEPSGRKSPCYSPADAFNEVPYEHGPDNRVSLPWSVPMLNLTKPTPPHSSAGSLRGDASPMMRPEDATVADINQPEKPSTASRVTWGESETVEYNIITPLESRDGFISDSPTPPTLDEVIKVVTIAPSVAPAMAGTDIRGYRAPVDEVTVRHMPGEFGDDLEFAATLAAGLQDTGFDPAIVIDDPTYRRRDSPPGSESINFYRQPFFETVTDLHLDSPGTEGAPPQRGFIEGELPSTPQDDGIPNVSGDTAVHSSRKEKRKGSKAAKGRETDGASTTRDSLSKPTTTDDRLREPGVYSEEPESMVSIPSGPSGYLVGPANPIKSERDHSKDRTEATKVTGPRSASRSRTDPQEYFDNQQTIQKPSIPRTKQDSWNMDLAASVPLPEDGPDELSSLKGLSIDDLKDNRASTNEVETPISRHVVPATGVPRTKGTRPESSSDLTHKSEQLETRTDRRASSPDESPDDSPSRYAVSSTVIPPDTQEDEDQGKRKKKSKRVGIPDDWSDRDSRPMSAGAAEQDEYQKPRKSKKKSKRDTVVVDDAVSAASAPAALEDDKTSRGKSKKDKKDKKGGLFGLFSSSKTYEDTPEVRKAPSEATVEDFQERKKSKSKLKDKDRSYSEDVYDVYGAAAQSVGDLSQIGQARDDNKDRKPQRSKEKEQRRRSRKEGIVESGITTQDLLSKHEQRTPSSEETPPQGTQLDTQIQTTAETQDDMVSFLGVGNDMPSVPDGVEPAPSTRTGEDLSQAAQPALQFRDSFNEPSLRATVRTPSPQRSDHAEFVGNSQRGAPASPTFAPAPLEHPNSGLQSSDHIPVSPAVPSPTAIPLHFRTPRPSTSSVRSSAVSSPAMAPDSPSHVVPRARHARPGSTEFRPLWLVERHKSREQFDPEEPYPSLPSSKTTSRSSSVHDVEDLAVTDEMTLAPSDGDFVLSVDVERSSESQDFLDSQQPTPVATSFPLALQRDESSEPKPNTLLDTELIRDTHVGSPEHLVAAPSSPPPQALGYRTTELRDNVSPAHFEDLQNLPPLPPSSNSSTYGDDELLSSSAIKDAAVAIGTSMGDTPTALLGRERIAEQTSLPSDSSDHIHSAKDIVRALDTAESQQKSIESEMESDSPPGNKATEEPQWQAEPSTTSTPDKGATVDDDMKDPVSPSQTARLAYVERRRELEEQDAQDAVDSWFAPPTLKKAKKEKQSKKQKNLGKAKIDGASKELPSASTSALGLTGEKSTVPVEALTEEHGDLRLPESLGRRQSNDKELSLTSVPPLHQEADQDESRAQVLQSVEEDAEWPERNRKTKKAKGKKADKKSSKLPTKSVEAVPLDRRLEAQLVPESPGDFQEAYSKAIKGDEDGREGEQPRALEKAENPDVTPEDELSVTLPSATPVESKAASEYALPSKKSKKDKKKAKQAWQAEPAIESTLKDPSPGVEIDIVNDGSSLVRTSSQPEERESEAMPSAPSSGHVTETSSDPVLATEFVVPTKRKGKAGKKQKLDLRSGRELLLRDSIPGAEEDTPRQLMIEPASMTSERSITPAAMEHTEPVLKVMKPRFGSSAVPDEPMQQDLDSGHASAIQANQTTQGNVQELSPLISAYPHPDDAPSTFELEQELTHHQSPAMIPLPEDEDSGLDDDRTDKELPQEAEVSHVAPGLEVEKDDMLQENNLLIALKSRSATPVGFPADRRLSIQISPETIPLPPDEDGELDYSSESSSPEGISGGRPIEEAHSMQVVAETIYSLSENDVGLSSSPTLEALDETPGAFRTDGTPSIQEAPEMVPLPPDKDGELEISPVPKAVDETPGSFPTEETPSVKVAPELVPLPANEDLELMSSPSLEPLSETPGAFPTKGMPSVKVAPELVPLPANEDLELMPSPSLETLSETPGAFPKGMPAIPEGPEILPLRSNRNGEIDRSPSLEPSSETSAALPTNRNPSTQTPLPLNEEVKLGRSATLKGLSETPGAFPAGQSSSIQVEPGVEPLLSSKDMELRDISDDERRQEVIPRAFDDSDVMPAVTARNGDDVQQYVGLPTSVPLAEELPGAFPTRFATLVQVAPEMVPLPEDDGTSQVDALGYSQTRSDIKADTFELGEVTPNSQAAGTGHLGQENDVSRAAVPDTALPGAFPTGRKASVKDTPEQVPLPVDEDMDLYNPESDDGFPVHTKDDDDGLQRTPSSSIIATPAVELPGAFPAALSTPAQALPAYFSSPPNESVDDREEQDELRSPEYAKTGGDDHSNGLRRQASLSGLATPAIELPGAFPPGQSTLLEASPGDGQMARNESVDLGDQKVDLQASESARTRSDDTNDGMQQEASSSISATPVVELPGAFPPGQSTLLQASPGDVQLPQNESLDLGDQQGNLQYSKSTRTGSDDYSDGMQEKASSLQLATPAAELPGAFPARKNSSVDVSPTDFPLPPDDDLTIFSPLEDEKYLPTAAIELPGAFPEQSTSVHISPEDVPLPPDEDMNGYKSLESDQYIATPAVEVPGAFPGDLDLGRTPSTQTEQNPSATSPELIPLPYNSDRDLDDAVNDSQAPRESTHGGDVVSAAELGPETVKEEVMQQGTRFPSVSTKPSTENLDLIRNSQDSKMSVPSTSALPSFDVANKVLLPEAIPLPETSASTPQDVIEPPLPEDVDQDNAPIGGSLLPANVALNLDSAASVSLPEGADLELRSPGRIPLPEGLDTVYPAAETTALGNAAYIESRPSETFSRQESRELESLSPEPASPPAITQLEFTSNTVHLPDDNDYGSISPNLVSLPYDADSDLRGPLMGAGPSPTAEDISVETAASLEGPMPNESRLVAGEDVVSRAGLEEPLDEQADEVAASLFSALSRKKGKKTKKQQSALSYIEHKSPEVGVTEEPRSMLKVNVQIPPESTAAVVSEASGVLAGPSLAGNQPDGQEYSAAVDAKGLFDAEAQPLTKKGKKNRKNKNLLSPFDGQTASITSSNPNTLSDMPGDAESSVTELPKPVQVPQPSDDTPREVRSEISTPSEGPLVRPLHLLEGLLGMSKKAKKRKGKNDKYLQDFESGSAVPEEPVASAESNREGDEGFETKRSSKSKKGKKKEKANTSRGTEDTTASATNEDFPATPHLIAVERPTMAGDQQPSTTTEGPENGPESATGALSKDSVQQSMSTAPLYDSVAHAEPGERDVNVNPKPRASDSDYLHEAAESQLPAENPVDFPVEEQEIEPEAEPYQPSFSLKKSKKDKKSNKNQTSIQNHEQPTSVAVSGTAYQYPTAGTSHEVTNAESESIVEPYHALRRAPSVVEPMELPKLPSDEVSTDSFTITGPPRNVVVPTEEAEDLSLQSLDINKGQIMKEPPVITNEVSVANDSTVPEQPRSIEDVQWQPSVKLTEPHSLDPSGARSFTTIPSSPDAHTLVASDLPMVTVGGPKSDKEQYTAFNQEFTTANETPTASDLKLAPLEAGFLGSNETPVVYPEQQSAIRSQDSAEPVSSQQEEDSWTTGTSGRAKKSKKRQKGALMSLQPKKTKEGVSDLYEFPEGSSALLGPSHELNRSGEKGVRNPTDYDTVLGPSSVEGAEPQGPKLAEDLEGHALQGDSSEEIVSRSLGKSPLNVVLDMTASHTQPDTMHGSDVQTLTEENAAEEVGKKRSTQEDEWPVGFTTKVKNKKGKKQNRNGRSLLAAEFREDASTSSTSTEKPRDGSVSPNHRVVLQQLETATQSDKVIVSMQDAPVAAMEENPSLARQDDDFSSFTPAKKGKKGKKSKKQSTGPAWYDETTGSGASTPAEAQAARSEPLEAEISRDKAGIAYAESLALIHTLPERSDVVLRYPDEFMEMPSMAEAASESIPASKGKGKKAKGSSNQSRSVGDIGSLTPEVLPEPANKARGTAGGSATAVLPTEDARSTDQPIILDDLPALPPSRPESRMCDAAKKAGTEDSRLRNQALSEPLPASRPTSPTALPLESAAHTRFQDEQQRKEISPMNLPPLPESRSDSPVPTAAENLIQTQLQDKHIDRGTPVESQADPASMKSSLPLLSPFEQTPLIQGDVISTNFSEPAQSHSFPTFPKFSGSLDVPDVDVDVVENFEAEEYKDNASRPFDATLGSATMESVRQQPRKEDPKKEKRKNKKKHKTFDWAEQEESITTRSASVNSDKELESRDEWNDLPSTASASCVLRAEQPQGLEIQSTIMPNQNSCVVSSAEHALDHHIRSPGKPLGGSQFNRDSAVHVSDSPLLPHVVPEYNSVRDSGYQDTTASPMSHSPQEFATGSELQGPLQNMRRPFSPDRPLTGPDDPHSTESFAAIDGGPRLEAIQSSRSPLRVSVELDPAYETTVLHHPTEPPINSGASVGVNWDMPVKPNESNDMEPLSDKSRDPSPTLLPQHDQREPSPVESATKDRSSVLFLSSPSTREDPTDQPTTQSPWQNVHDSAEGRSQKSPIGGAETRGGDVEISGVPHDSRKPSVPQAAVAEWVPNTAASHALSDPPENSSLSLFGGPVGINSDDPFEGSLPPGHLGFNSSERTALDTIVEHSPEDSPLLKKTRALPDIGSPEREIKSMRRSATPRFHRHDELQSPPVLGEGIRPYPQPRATPPDSGILSTDDFIARLSWPAVDEDNHLVDLNRVKSRNTDRHASSHSNGSARVRDGEFRSTSGQSIRSGGSINRFRTPDRDQILRPASGVSNRSASGTGTPPLRRVDRSLSGDLRAANRRSEAKLLAKQPDLGFDVDPHIPSSSTYDPIKDKGKGRVRGMTDVYEGWGDVPGSPLSPTRPPSVRRRQSMQIIDLETKLDQLASENRLLQDAKSKAERGIEDLGYTHDRNENAAREALETRDLQLRERDSEILKLRETLELVQGEVARLTEVNKSLAATNLSHSSDHDDRYSQLQLEHDNTKEQWQQSARELEQLRQQHVHLSTGMEDIVRHEISIALNDKNAEVRRLRDELEAAKEQVRALQQQILVSKPSDDVLVTRDEDYFDGQCQQLCQHVQQWVMRFSKFSDSRPCRLTSEVTDEKITDRFDNAILDGSDVDNYLADRKRRRDVFMSVVMTMVWEFIFTRYLFGMDREQRQKLKSLEKLLGEVGPMKAVHRWRATTLMLLSRRQAFQAQRVQDTEAVVQEIFQTLAAFLPPPSQHIKQAKESLRNVMKCAVDLSVEMRTQRAEYIMLPPLQPEYDTNGDLVRKVYFNAAVMNERSGTTTSNEELDAQHVVVRIVLFPLVVKKGDDDGLGNEEIVVCPAQVLVAKPGKEKKVVRVLSGDRMSVDQAAKSVLSFAPSSMDMGNMI